MKFYQIIAPATLSIMYTTTIFGIKETTLPYVPKVICELIDEFCSGKKEVNDTFYKKTGHLKPYSYLPHLLTCLTMYRTPRTGESKNFLQFTICCISTSTIMSILALTLPKIFPALYKTSLGLLLPAISSTLLALPVGLSADYIVAKTAEKLSNSHLAIKSPTQIVIKSPTQIVIWDDWNDSEEWDDSEEIVVTNLADNIAEVRSLSDMRLKGKLPLDMMEETYFSCDNQRPRKRDGLTYKLNDDGKIDTYLSNNDYSPPNDLPKDDYESGNRLCRLSTPTGVISFDFSEDKKTIMALNKKGFLHKLELQNRQSLHEIINSMNSE